MTTQNWLSQDDSDLLKKLQQQIGRAVAASTLSVKVWDTLLAELPRLPGYQAEKVRRTVAPKLRDEIAKAAVEVEYAESELRALLMRSRILTEEEM
ncbi:MAG: hypothetical protein FJ317_05065, partial [SAR202 cluster bacterium]|nr:hypothetical protein [SAR202 cluster bacterium]